MQYSSILNITAQRSIMVVTYPPQAKLLFKLFISFKHYSYAHLGQSEELVNANSYMVIQYSVRER